MELLRSYQTLLQIVIKVAFGFIVKHDVRHGQSRRDLPLPMREISMAPLSYWIKECVAMLRLGVDQLNDLNHSIKNETEVGFRLDRIS